MKDRILQCGKNFMKSKIFQSFVILSLIPVTATATSAGDHFDWYFEMGYATGGSRLIGYDYGTCNLLEKAFGCREGSSSISAGDGFEVSLGGIYKLAVLPLNIRFVHTFSYLNDTTNNHGEVTYRRPHTNIALEYRIAHHRLVAGLARYQNANLHLYNWSLPNPYSGNEINFNDTTGWFVEYKIKDYGNSSIGLRKAFVDFQVNKIDNMAVSNGGKIRGDYAELFFTYEL